MAVSEQTPSNSSTGNGVTTVFPYTFKILAAADLDVLVDGVEQTLNSDYTVSGAGDDEGGNVTFITAPAAGSTVVRRRNMALVRTTDYQDQGELPADTLNADQDAPILMLQQVQEQVGRALTAPAGESAPDPLPAAADRAGMFLTFDSNGNPSLSTGTGADSGLRADLAASDGAALVGFLNDSAGAVARTIEERGRDQDVLSTDYGTLQQALTAAAALGRVLRIVGSYSLESTTLTVPSNCIVDARGATLTWTGNVTGLQFGANVRWLGGSLIGAGNAAYNDNGRAIACVGANNSPAAPTYVDGPRVEDVTIDGWSGYGFYFKYLNRPVVIGCTIKNIGYAALAGMSCNDGVFDHNKVKTVTPGSGPGDAYGCFWDRSGESVGTETTDPRSYRCSASFNEIDGVTGWEAIDSHAGVDMRFVGNHITNCKSGIVYTASKIGGVSALAPRRGVIAHNTIEIGYGLPAIVVGGAYNGTSFVQFAEGVAVTGNTIKGGGLAGDQLTGSILLQGTKDVAVVGNTIREPRVWGINAYFSNIGFSICGNTIIDPFDNQVTSPGCIGVRGNDNRGLIEGNTFRYETPGLGTYVAITSINFQSGLSGTDVRIGRNAYIGIATGRLEWNGPVQTGIHTGGAAQDCGSATIAVVSTGGDGIVDVTFGQRMPFTPKSISVQLRHPFNQGGKFPLVGVDTVTSPTPGGFRIYAKPVDGSTWSASGNLTVSWHAST